MTMYVEKREYERHSYQSPISVSYFNLDNYCSAKSINYSMDGICFEGDCAFNPGAAIYVRREKCTANNSATKIYEGCRTIALAKIRWIKKLPNGRDSKYSIGAKYYEPYQ